MYLSIGWISFSSVLLTWKVTSGKVQVMSFWVFGLHTYYQENEHKMVKSTESRGLD